MDRNDAKNDEVKIEFQKAVMGDQDEKQEENLETIQMDMEGGCRQSDKAVKLKPESVRMREEAAAGYTKAFKRRVLKKQARKVRADHLLECGMMPGRVKTERKPSSELYVNGKFTEDRAAATQ